MSDASRPVRFATEELLAHADWARGLAARLVHDASDADDLVQDAMAAAIRRPPLADRPLRPWLAAVLRKLALARRRGDGRRARRETTAGREAALGHVPPAADVVAGLDAHRVLAETVAALPEPLRATIYMRYYEGLDSTEIGRRQAIPAATVRWRLAHAIEELRVRLDARSPGGRSEWTAALAPIAAPRFVPPAPAPSPSPTLVTSVLTGVIAMTTTTKILLGGAAGIALLALLWNTDVLDTGRASHRDGGADDVAAVATPGAARADAPRAESRETPARAPRRRDSADDERTDADAASGAVPSVGETASGVSAFEVRAHVVDASGAPAAGARVECRSGAKPAGGDGDDEGRVAFHLDVAAKAESFDFVVSATRAATRVVVAAPPRSAPVLDLGDVFLAVGGAATGRVLDGDRPLGGVAIRVVGTGANGMRNLAAAPAAESDADGRFTLRGVSVGTQHLRLAKDGFRPADVVAEIRAGEECPLELVVLEHVDPAAMVRGTVHTPDGAPAAGALVSYRFQDGRSTGVGSATADESGRFEIEGGREKSWRLAATDPSGRWSGAAVAEVRSGADGIVLRLTEVRWADVAVTRADGVPVDRFEVELRGPGDFFFDRLAEDVRAGGVVRITLPAQPFTVSVTAPGCAVATAGPLDPAKVEGRIGVVVTPLPGLRGRVTAAGLPVANAWITLREFVRPGTREIRNGFPSATFAASVSGVATDGDGAYELTLRRAGRFVLRAEAPDFAPAEAGPFDLVPEVGMSGIAIALTTGGGIEGHVLAAAGRGVEGIFVGISRGDGEPRTLRTGPDGAFRFERLTPGPWEVRPTASEIRPGEISVTSTVGEARFDWSVKVADGAVAHFDIDLRVEPKSAVRGELRVDGRPAAGWKVALLAGTGITTSEQVASGTVAERGEFRLVAPRPGDHLVAATSPRGLLYFAPVRLGDTESAIALDIESGTVGVRGAAGGDALFFLWEDASGRCALAQPEIDTAGASAPSTFPAGRVRLVRPAAGEFDPRKWTTVAEGVLTAGGTVTLDLAAK